MAFPFKGKFSKDKLKAKKTIADKRRGNFGVTFSTQGQRFLSPATFKSRTAAKEAFDKGKKSATSQKIKLKRGRVVRLR